MAQSHPAAATHQARRELRRSCSVRSVSHDRPPGNSPRAPGAVITAVLRAALGRGRRRRGIAARPAIDGPQMRVAADLGEEQAASNERTQNKHTHDFTLLGDVESRRVPSGRAHASGPRRRAWRCARTAGRFLPCASPRIAPRPAMRRRSPRRRAQADGAAHETERGERRCRPPEPAAMGMTWRKMRNTRTATSTMLSASTVRIAARAPRSETHRSERSAAAAPRP